MRVLAIETSGSVGGVALLEDEQVLAERIFEKGMVHGQELAPAMAELLEECSMSIREVDLIAVDIGPGSFTGLRVGLAAAKGLCLVLTKPILGIVSLDAMAEGAQGHGAVLCPVIDAKWDRLYSAIYGPHRLSEIFSEKPDRLVRKIPKEATVFGSALPKYAALFGDRSLLGSEFAFPRASHVGRVAVRQHAAGRKDDIMSLVPLYLGATEAEIKARKP